jgi:hypothetical protein
LEFELRQLAMLRRDLTGNLQNLSLGYIPLSLFPLFISYLCIFCSLLLSLLYAFLWVIPLRLNFICRRFGTHCLFHLHRQVGMKNTKLFMKMEQTVCSETSAYIIQTPGNYPEDSIQHSEHGERLKSRILLSCLPFILGVWSQP